MKKCITCGAVFTGTQPSKKFCSLACNRINAAKYQRESAIKRRERNRVEFEESQKKKGANYEPLEVGKYNRIAPKIIGDALYIGGQVRRRERALENIGWTLEAYDAAHAEQGGKCFICGKKSNKSLAADHNHTTGKPRRLLCYTCNKTLGIIEKHMGIAKVFEYLTQPHKWENSISNRMAGGVPTSEVTINGTTIRVLDVGEGKEWVAKDITVAIGMKKSGSNNLLAKFAKGERSDRVIQTTSGVQKMVTLTKAGVIRLIQTSKKQGRHALTQLVSNDMVDCAV